MIGKFSNSVNVEQNNNGGNSGGGSGGNNSFPLPIPEEDAFLQGNIGSPFSVADTHPNQRERMGGAQPETDAIRQKNFNSTLSEDLYTEETFWGSIEADSYYNFYVSPLGLLQKKDRLYGRTIVANGECIITIPPGKSARILKRSDASRKLTISTHNGQEKEYVGSPTGTVLLVTLVFSSRVLVISEVYPSDYEETSTN